MDQELRPLTTEELYDIDGGGLGGCALSSFAFGFSAATGNVPGMIFGAIGIAISCYN